MKNSRILKIATHTKLIIFFFGLGLFASCSEEKSVVPIEKEIAFDSKTYKFKNQDPESIAARKAIDSGVKLKGARTVTNPNGGSGYANLSFNPSGYQIMGIGWQPGLVTYRASANIQNYFSYPITVRVEIQSNNISNIWVSGGSYNQTGSRTYEITIQPYSTVFTNFNLNFYPVETWAKIEMIAPFYVPANNSNDWVYPIV